MIASNMSREKYEKMPRFAKVIYWISVIGLLALILYFVFTK
jgi:hypothetical protein